MQVKPALLFLGVLAVAAAQTPSKAVVVNLETANWTHEKNDPPDSSGVMLHSDASSGAMDLLVRCPTGHVIAPRSHDSNELIGVVEGQLTLRQESGDQHIDAGGFAYLPAHE